MTLVPNNGESVVDLVQGIAVDARFGSSNLVFCQGGGLYSLDITSGNIKLIIGNRKEGTGYAEGNKSHAQFSKITSFTQKRIRQGDWRFLIVDSNNHRIRWVHYRSKNSSTTLLAGITPNQNDTTSIDGNKDTATFYFPYDIILDWKTTKDRVGYVSEPLNSKIRMIKFKGSELDNVSTLSIKSFSPYTFAFGGRQNIMYVTSPGKLYVLKIKSRLQLILSNRAVHDHGGGRSAGITINEKFKILMATNTTLLIRTCNHGIGHINVDDGIFYLLCGEGVDNAKSCKVNGVTAAVFVNPTTIVLGGNQSFSILTRKLTIMRYRIYK